MCLLFLFVCLFVCLLRLHPLSQGAFYSMQDTTIPPKQEQANTKCYQRVSNRARRRLLQVTQSRRGPPGRPQQILPWASRKVPQISPWASKRAPWLPCFGGSLCRSKGAVHSTSTTGPPFPLRTKGIKEMPLDWPPAQLGLRGARGARGPHKLCYAVILPGLLKGRVGILKWLPLVFVRMFVYILFDGPCRFCSMALIGSV